MVLLVSIDSWSTSKQVTISLIIQCLTAPGVWSIFLCPKVLPPIYNSLTLHVMITTTNTKFNSPPLVCHGSLVWENVLPPPHLLPLFFTPDQDIELDHLGFAGLTSMPIWCYFFPWWSNSSWLSHRLLWGCISDLWDWSDITFKIWPRSTFWTLLDQSFLSFH